MWAKMRRAKSLETGHGPRVWVANILQLNSFSGPATAKLSERRAAEPDQNEVLSCELLLKRVARCFARLWRHDLGNNDRASSVEITTDTQRINGGRNKTSSGHWPLNVCLERMARLAGVVSVRRVDIRPNRC